MRKPFYRYFLGFRPDAWLRATLVALGEEVGQRLQSELLHLTLCVIAEADEPDPFLCRRVGAALADQTLSSVPIRLGRVRGGDHGAVIQTIGNQADVQHFYRVLVGLLARRGIPPLYRKSGLHPHVTLGYAACRFDPFATAIEWLPSELLLIESEVGNGKHRVIGRWPLLPPPQGVLDLRPGAAAAAASRLIGPV